MGSSVRKTAGVLLVLLAGASIMGCPPPVVVIDGQELTVAEAAKLAYQDARKEAEAGRKPEAIKKYQAYLEKYSEEEQADDALAALGQLSYQTEQYEQAVKYCRTLVAEHPQSPHYVSAAVQLGLSLAKLGRTREALPTLQSVFDRLPSTKKKAEVAGMLAESYTEAGAPVEALRWFSVLYQLTTVPGAQEAIRRQVVELIDRRMSFKHVRESLEVLKQAEVKGFPLDLLQYKLARIFYHIYNFDHARDTLETFVADFPDHEFSKDAGQLLKKIMDRNRVSPQSIGVLLPLTGKYRDYGRRALEGIQLGAGIFEDQKEGSNTPGPVLVIRDTAADPDKAIKQLEDLVYNEHVIAVIGPMVAKVAYASAVKAQELEVPIVTLAIRKDITEVGSWVFRNFLTLAAQARLLVSHAAERLGVKRFALLYPNDPYGVEFANAFWDEVDRRQGEVRAAERYEPDAKNFAAPIKKLVGRFYLEARYDFIRERSKIRAKIKNPVRRKRAMEKLYKTLQPIVDFQALFIPEYSNKAVMIAPALAFEDIVLWTESQWKIQRMKKSLGRSKLDMIYLLGGNGWNSLDVVKYAERYVQGAIFCDGFFLESKRPQTRLFVGKFKTNFNREPSMVEAEAYDTAMIFRAIVETQRPANRQAFRSKLLNMKKFPGATGDTSFNEDGEVEKNLFLLTIKKDDIIEVDLGPPADAPTG